MLYARMLRHPIAPSFFEVSHLPYVTFIIVNELDQSFLLLLTPPTTRLHHHHQLPNFFTLTLHLPTITILQDYTFYEGLYEGRELSTTPLTQVNEKFGLANREVSRLPQHFLVGIPDIDLKSIANVVY